AERRLMTNGAASSPMKKMVRMIRRVRLCIASLLNGNLWERKMRRGLERLHFPLPHFSVGRSISPQRRRERGGVAEKAKIFLISPLCAISVFSAPLRLFDI